MTRIGELELYVGSKEEEENATNEGMNLVIALNQAAGYKSHRTIVGWHGRGCNKDNPYYLYKEDFNYIALNLIDTDDVKYIPDEIVNKSLGFIHSKLVLGEKVFIYCSKGESRSPSLALMYLLEYNYIEKNEDVFNIFRRNYYESYNPKKGFEDYINKRWIYF